MSIAENLARVREQVAEACARAGRPASDVALMAVSKIHPVEAMLEAYAAGQRLFGENRVQEWEGKSVATAGMPGIEVHLIGPLQSNKTARAAGLFDAIETVDSGKIARRLDEAGRQLGRVIPVHVEVKVSHEEAKHGIAPAELPELLDQMAALVHVRAVGLMTVPPWSEDAERARPYFRELRRLRDAHPGLTELSMGMSGDFWVAIEEGSTCVRVGTALFGKRTVS